MKANEFDQRFHSGEDISSELDLSEARRPGQEQRTADVDDLGAKTQLRQLDQRLFTALNGLRLPGPIEQTVRLVSHLGLFPTNVILWALVAWAFDRRLGAYALAGLLVAWMLCRVIKLVFPRRRPHTVVASARLIGRAPGGSSFPSSHAALVTFSAVVISWGEIEGGGTATLLGLGLIWVAVLTVYFARIHLGAHYPSDVAAGAVIGGAVALVTLKLLG